MRNATIALLFVFAAPTVAIAQDDAATVKRWFDELRGTALDQARERAALAKEGLGEFDASRIERIARLKLDFVEGTSETRGVIQFDPKTHRVLVSRDLMETVDRKLNRYDVAGEGGRLRAVGFLLGEAIAQAGGAPSTGHARANAYTLMEAAPAFKAVRGHPDSDWQVDLREAVAKLRPKPTTKASLVARNTPVIPLDELETAKRLRSPIDWRTATDDVLAKRPDAIFEALKEGLVSVARETHKADPAEKLASMEERVRSLRLNVVPNADVFMRLDKSTHTLRLSTGYISAVRDSWIDEGLKPGSRMIKQVWTERLVGPLAEVANVPKAKLWSSESGQDWSEKLIPAERVPALRAGTWSEFASDLSEDVRSSERSSTQRAARRSLTLSLANDFEAQRGVAIARREALLERTTNPAQRELIENGLRTLRALEFDVSSDYKRWSRVADGNLTLSEGLLDASRHHRTTNTDFLIPEAASARTLTFLVSRELARASGIVGEANLDAEGMRLFGRTPAGGTRLSPAELKEATWLLRGAQFHEETVVEATARKLRERSLEKLARTHDAALKTPKTEYERAADHRARVAAEHEALGRFAEFRRADGTLDIARLTGSGALRQVGGVAHFGLALFLKEIAVVIATGDRARINEFFDGLMTTDFYTQYGLFIAGARGGQVAYAKYLQRYIKPNFVNSLLKTNVALAAGLALPMIVEGHFTGKTFAISLASLGLSSAAVRSGIAGIKWVKELRTAKRASSGARAVAGATRLARAGGWIYTAAELAVILLVAEKIETAAHTYLDAKAAREALAEAGSVFLDAVNHPNADAAAVEAAVGAYDQAWNDYRRFLYRPLEVDDAVFSDRLVTVARDAKLEADERAALIARVTNKPALLASIKGRHGTVEAYADARLGKRQREIASRAKAALDSYEKSRDEHLDAIYRDNRRETPFLQGVDNLDWLLGGGRPNAVGDPWNGRADFNARKARQSALRDLSSGFLSVSRNKLESYDDEIELFKRLAARMRHDGRNEEAKVIDARREQVEALVAADRALTGNSEGATGAVERALSGEK
jgi:hypothetical protein